MDGNSIKIIAILQTALTEREWRELSLACLYRDHYQHGTDGHNRLMLIAKLYDLLLKYVDGD